MRLHFYGLNKACVNWGYKTSVLEFIYSIISLELLTKAYCPKKH